MSAQEHDRPTVVPLNDIGRAVREERARLQEAIATVLEGGSYVLGDQHSAFEAEFAQFVGAPYALGVANGTDALGLALLAVGVESGANVVTVANAGGYSTNAIRSIGARARYVDVEPVGLNMSTEGLREALVAGRPAAVIVTHLYGNAAEVTTISDLCQQADVPLVEDCAQATGLQVDGRHVGTFGDAGAFSFYPTKNLGALGDGGMVVATNEQVAARVRLLRQYGWSPKFTVSETCGRNSRLDELQAAILRVRLPLVDGRNERRRQILNCYAEALPSAAGRIVRSSAGVAHLAVALVDDRARTRAALHARGVTTDVHYPIPDHCQPAWVVDAEGIHLPVTEHVRDRVLTLPCFPELTQAETDVVCEALRALG